MPPTKRSSFKGFNEKSQAELISMVVGVKVDKSGVVQAANAMTNFFASFEGAGSAIIWFDRLAYAVENTFTRIDAALKLTGTMDFGKKVVGNANYIGVATDKFQAFNSAMGTYGANMDDMMDGFVTLNERVQEFIRGEAYVKEFEFAGFKKSDFDKDMDMVDQFLVVADVMNKAAPNVSAFWSSAVLGDQLNRILGPTLTKGSLAILAKMVQVKRSGIVLDKQQLEILEKAANRQRELSNIIEGIRQDVATHLLDAFSELVDYVMPDMYQLATNIDIKFRKIAFSIQHWFVNKFFDNIDELREMYLAFDGLPNVFERIGKAVGLMLVYFAALTAIALSPLLLWFVAAVVVFDDIIQYLETGDSLMLGYLMRQPMFRVFLSFLMFAGKEILRGLLSIGAIAFRLMSSRVFIAIMIYMITSLVGLLLLVVKVSEAFLWVLEKIWAIFTSPVEFPLWLVSGSNAKGNKSNWAYQDDEDAMNKSWVQSKGYSGFGFMGPNGYEGESPFKTSRLMARFFEENFGDRNSRQNADGIVNTNSVTNTFTINTPSVTLPNGSKLGPGRASKP
jgi:hypothetical protein